jgi:hypothetical protein
VNPMMPTTARLPWKRWKNTPRRDRIVQKDNRLAKAFSMDCCRVSVDRIEWFPRCNC